MAFVVFVVEIPAQGIGQLNSQLQRPTKPYEAVNQASALFAALGGGAVDGAIQITTRDSDPGVSTSGSGSDQEYYNLK